MSNAQAATAPAPARSGRSLWGDALLRLSRSRVAVICLIVIVVYALVSLFAPFIFADWDQSYDYDNTNAPPSLAHPLGTDTFGRSVLVKTLLGARTSMTVGFMANIIAVPLGMALGAIAGYYGGFVDDIIVWLYTTMASIPGIIRLVALKFAFEETVIFEGRPWELDLSGIAGIYIALGVMSWIGTCRLVRAETLKIRELDYVVASKAAGRRSVAILFRHIIPNVSHIGIIQFSLGFVWAITAEVILSYLGIGVMDRPSWGRMINAARMDLVNGEWIEFAAAVVAMFIIVLAWSIFGDRLRDALDPRLRGVRK